jgi:hypothetical protein
VNAGAGGTGVTVGHYPLDPASPYFLDVLISCRHGAFHWAPVLGVSLLGLMWSLGRKNAWAGVLLAAFAAQVYLIGGLGLSHLAYGDGPPEPGWLHHWDDTPSFGMRYLAECAPIFALGLASLIEATRRRIGLLVWGAVLVPFALWNGMLIVAYGLETITRTGCLPYSDMLAGFRAVFHSILQR